MLNVKKKENEIENKQLREPKFLLSCKSHDQFLTYHTPPLGAIQSQ